jgi:hypothetical protein
MTRGTAAGRLLRPEEWVTDRSDALGRSWSGGVSVPRSKALASFAQPDLSDGSGAQRSETILPALDVETPLVEEAAASAAGVVLANCGVIDAMVATLVDVESLKGKLDWLLAAVAQPERPPMTLVAF